MASVDSSPPRPASSATSNNTSATAAVAPKLNLDLNIDDNDDLDPAAFLKSVRELSERREREDNERFRKLEEDIEKGRQERLARRAERAKSIVSDASGSAPSYSLHSRPTSSYASPPATPKSTATMDTTTPKLRNSSNGVEDVPEFKGFGSLRKTSAQSTPGTAANASSTREPTSPSKPSPSAAMPSRSGTVKWQQRPTSRGTGSRPISMFVGGNNTQTSKIATNEPEPEPSRDQIAAALGSRDPSWFRQTADRGVGNAAYRKSKDELGLGESAISERRGLPGMSRESSIEPSREFSLPPESVTSEAPSKSGSVRGSGAWNSRLSATTSISDHSRPAFEPQKATPSMSDRASITDSEQPGLGRTLTMSSSQARLAGDRPASPTKGMGGFVQSAMMKRSDSVNKRWSAQPVGNLSRQNSSASVRSGYGVLQGSHSMPKLEPVGDSRESSNEPLSRPSSSSSNLPNLALGQSQVRTDDGFVKPALPHHARSKTVTSVYTTNVEQDSATSPPASPSKRWSPNKSSWLENALARPDSPKPLLSKPNQPSWMADIARAKAQKASVDLTPRGGTPVQDTSRPSSPTKTPVAVQGLLRRSESRNLAEMASTRSITPPTRTKPLSLASRPASMVAEPKQPQVTQDKDERTAPEETQQGAEKAVIAKPQPQSDDVKPKTIKLAPLTPSKSEPLKTPANPIAGTEPDTPSKPQTDFRNTLRSRPPTQPKSSDEPEFLSKFGALRKAQTEKYVAPDRFKDNILRGKSGLNLTGGVPKREKKDELRDSLLAKKEQMRKEKEEGIVHERKISGPPITPSKPEALAKKELLGRAGSMKVPEVSPEKEKAVTPEALRTQRSLREKQKMEPKAEDKPEPEPKLEMKPAPLFGKKAIPQSAHEKPKMEPKIEDKPASEPKLDLKPTPLFERKMVSQPAQEKPEAATPMSPPLSPPTESSKLAARFNPGLARILALGPPASTNSSPSGSRSGSPSGFQRSAITSPGEPPAEGGQLQDMRKGRAKGPKRRKAGTAVKDDNTNQPEPESRLEEPLKAIEPQRDSMPASTPAGPTSSASIMRTSLAKPVTARDVEAKSSDSVTPARPAALFSKPVSSPRPFAKAMESETPVMASKSPFAKPEPKPEIRPQPPAKDTVPEFKGFGSISRSRPSQLPEEDKENSDGGPPSVKNAASFWAKPSPSTLKPMERPSQIQLPNKRDEEAAMRSAGLLASSSSPSRSPGRPDPYNGLGISVQKSSGPASTPPPSAGLPPKPAKPSRIVSGQLREASPNKCQEEEKALPRLPQTEAERLLQATFGTVPAAKGPLTINTETVVTSSPHPTTSTRTIRKTIQQVGLDGSMEQVRPQEEYTLFDESVYMCTHVHAPSSGSKATQIFIWVGESSSETAVESAQSAAKVAAKAAGSAPVHVVHQGHESPSFLEAIGGIFITRRGSRQGAPKQYMLCGRKHLGHIVFDEVDFAPSSLGAAFAYLISYPVTLQETRLYLWKGSACSTEEIGAAKLAAMDLSETGELIEVDQGVEFSSFLRIFGPGTTKSSIPKPSDLCKQKALAPSKFAPRLFKIQPAEIRTSLFSSMFSRRPSWGRGASPNRSEDDNTPKLEAKEISPFTQSDLEPEHIYLLDAYAELYILLGPLFPSSHTEALRHSMLAQTLLLASDYGILAVSLEDRPCVPKACVVFSGAPEAARVIFRGWDESRGLWGTEGLMAGSKGVGKGLKTLSLDEVVRVVCR